MPRRRLYAVLCEPAPPRGPGAKGRPRKKGARLPTLAQVLADPATVWQTLSITGWYGTPERRLEICSQTAVWFHSGLSPVPIRWVLLRDPQGEFDPQALLCTNPARTPLQIIRWFVQRWPVEVTCREARDHLGLETQRQWSDRAIARTLPAGPVLPHRPARHSTQPTHQARRSRSSVVPQDPTHLCRHTRRRAPGNLGRSGFCHVAHQIRQAETPHPTARRHRLRPLPRSMSHSAKWPKSNLG